MIRCAMIFFVNINKKNINRMEGLSVKGKMNVGFAKNKSLVVFMMKKKEKDIFFEKKLRRSL